MKKVFSHTWKVIVLTLVYFIVNSLMGMLLPLSNDLFAAMSLEDQSAFLPLFLLNTFINMNVIFLVLTKVHFKGWKLFFAVWLATFGIFGLVNYLEMFWYNKAFPLITYLDAIKVTVISLISYGITSFAGVLLANGFKRQEKERKAVFIAGKYAWRIILFCVTYPFIYLAFGFIPWAFPAVREFYADWALTSEPIPFLLLFNVLRGFLWFLSSLPILTGMVTRKQTLWMMPLILVCGTALTNIIPSAIMPFEIRIPHIIELGSSMTLIGLYLVWLFVRSKETAGKE